MILTKNRLSYSGIRSCCSAPGVTVASPWTATDTTTVSRPRTSPECRLGAEPQPDGGLWMLVQGGVPGCQFLGMC